MRAAAVCSMVVGLCALAASAQVTTQGAVAPGQSFSLQDDGTSLGGNPAGLGYVRGFEADFLHNGFYAAGPRASTRSTSPAGAGPALARPRLRLVRARLVPAHQRGSGAAPRRAEPRGRASRVLRPGAVVLGFRRAVAAAALPLAGAALLDANRPGPLPRRWPLSAAVRPLRESLDLAADLRWSECSNAPGPACGLDHKDWLFTAQARVFRGVTLVGQLGLLDGSRTTGLVGVQLDLAHAGIAYAPVFGAGDAQDAWRIRASTQKWPSVSLPTSRTAEIDLKTALRRPRPGPAALLFGATTRDPLQRDPGSDAPPLERLVGEGRGAAHRGPAPGDRAGRRAASRYRESQGFGEESAFLSGKRRGPRI